MEYCKNNGDGTLGVSTSSRENLIVRAHDEAVKRWLNKNFLLIDGYPIPALIANPTDAYAMFVNMWKRDDNPYAYLTDLKDSRGANLYNPSEPGLMYPIISILRSGISYRQNGNFSIHKWRRISYPTVSNKVSKCDLGTVTTSRMPMGFNFKYQIDFMSTSMYTQAMIVQSLANVLHTTGGNLRFWIPVVYPGVMGEKLVQSVIDSDNLDNSQEKDPDSDNQIVFRLSIPLTLEGYIPDIEYRREPTLWSVVLNSASTNGLDNVDSPVSVTDDLRKTGINSNSSVEVRENIPPVNDCDS